MIFKAVAVCKWIGIDGRHRLSSMICDIIKHNYFLGVLSNESFAYIRSAFGEKAA